MSKLLGALLLLVALGAAAIGVGWVWQDAIGTEWDLCLGGGSGCISGWKIGAGFIVLAALVGVLGFALLRQARR